MISFQSRLNESASKSCLNVHIMDIDVDPVMILRCGHGCSVIIVGIRNKATTSDWLISLSRFSNASIIERIPTHAAVAAL